VTGKHSRSLILIGGYGRSGSTIVDMELSRHFAAHSLGEVRYAKRHIVAGYRKCSCGADFSDCEFWSNYTQDDQLLNATSVVEHTNVVSALAMAFSSTKKLQIKALFNSFFDRSLPRQVLVDSSKTSWGAFLRPFVLACALKSDVNIIFIGVYRNPENVLQSLRRGSNEEMGNESGKSILSDNKRIGSPLLKLIAGWSHANVAVLLNVLLLRVMGQQAKVFAYEDIVKDFSLVTRSVDLEVQPELGLESHLIGGNRVAGGGDVRIKAVVPSGVGVGVLVRVFLWVGLGLVRVALSLVRVKP
jgi:hypothetical protein